MATLLELNWTQAETNWIAILILGTISLTWLMIKLFNKERLINDK
jgi:hypothetical protein